MDKLIEEGVKVDCIITSPPYNIGKEYEKEKELEVYLLWQNQVLSKAFEILSEDGILLLNVGTYIDKYTNNIPLSFEFYNILRTIGFKLRQNIIWSFNSGLSAKKKLSGRYEDIMWWYKGEKLPIFNLEDIRVKEWKKFDKRNNPNGKNPTNVWNINLVKGNSNQKKNHPCQFPEKLIIRLIKGMTDKTDIILDLFSGSGTTAVAAENTNRKWICIEKEEKYCEITKKRLDNSNQK